jgi:hypothetical protein
LLAQEYTMASHIARTLLPTIELTVGDLVQLGKLADFLESPALLHVRMALVYGDPNDHRGGNPKTRAKTAQDDDSSTHAAAVMCSLPAVHCALYGLSEALALHTSALGSYLPRKQVSVGATTTFAQPRGHQAAAMRGARPELQQQQQDDQFNKVKRSRYPYHLATTFLKIVCEQNELIRRDVEWF